MLNHDGAYLLEVMVGKENNVFPMVAQGSSVSEIRFKIIIKMERKEFTITLYTENSIGLIGRISGIFQEEKN